MVQRNGFHEDARPYDNAYKQLMVAAESGDDEAMREALYVMLRHVGAKQ